MLCAKVSAALLPRLLPEIVLQPSWPSELLCDWPPSSKRMPPFDALCHVEKAFDTASLAVENASPDASELTKKRTGKTLQKSGVPRCGQLSPGPSVQSGSSVVSL